MNTTDLHHAALADRHSDAHNLASLAGTLADALTDRCVHPNDAGKPDLGAVAGLLAESLAAHGAALSALIDQDAVLRARISEQQQADGVQS